MKRILSIVLLCAFTVCHISYVHADKIEKVQNKPAMQEFSEQGTGDTQQEYNRFIIKYKQKESNEKEKTINKVSEVYSKLKNEKRKKERDIIDIREQRGNIDITSESHPVKEKSLTNENRSEVFIREKNSSLLDINVVELSEEIGVEGFVKQITNELYGEIEYIIPDYRIELSAKDSKIIEKELNSVTAEEVELSIEQELNKNMTSNESDAETIEVVQEIAEEAVPGETAAVENVGSLIDKDSDIREAHEATKGNGIIIALIDDGMDFSHKFFNGKIADGAWDFYNDTEYSYEYCNSMNSSHGTHIAGIISTVAPESKILPLKVFENGTAYTSDIIEAIEYAEVNGAKVVNCSWGCTDENIALKETMKKSNMIFVAAAGNNRLDLAETSVYPAMYNLDNTISVGSINEDGGLSYFSNYSNQYVDITAWGREVYSTLPNNGFGTMSGTSMAAAYVTGTAALMLSNGMETDSIKEAIKHSADKLSCLHDTIIDGNKLNITNSAVGVSGAEIITVHPVDDFNADGYEGTPQANWELFCVKDNVDIKVGTDFAAVLKGDGTVWTWGNNYYGQLGNNSVKITTDPVKVIGLTDVIQIASGRLHSLALKSDGTVWAWGYNAQGQLGDSTTTSRMIPVQVIGLSDIAAIDASGLCSMALKSDGTVWTWGYNYYGQAGIGTTGNNTVPVKASGIDNIVKINCGEYNSMAMSDDGNLYTWGYNYYGQLGIGNTKDVYIPTKVTVIDNIKEFTATATSTIVLKNDGTVWSWGYEMRGELGTGKDSKTSVPEQITGLVNVKSIYSAKGGDTNFAVKENGSLWAWGDNTKGQIGNGTTTDCYTPVQVSGIEEVECITSNDTFSAAICRDGAIRTWGNNTKGQLGYGRTIYSTEPARIKTLSNIQGISDTSAVNSAGKVYAWGYNGNGQLGNGTLKENSFPLLVSSISNVVMTSSSDRHKLAVTSDGKLYAWGYNGNGQLGNGTTTTVRSPALISSISDVTMASAGYMHSIALKSDGTVWTWGYNNHGQLGNGTTEISKNPVQVSGLTDIIAVSAGNYHNFALKSDGTVYAWGYNGYGQLGDGTTATAKTPLKISTLSGITKVAAGIYHSMALKSDGTVYVWGYNGYGQLGNNSTTQKTTPERNSYLSNIIDIDAGGHNSAAVSEAGSLYAWGYNGYGQIGSSTKTIAKTPNLVENLTDVVKTAVSNYSDYGNTIVALKSDGTVYSMGSNLNFQLGQGDIITQLTPEAISGDMSDTQGNSFTESHEIDIPYQNTAYINYAADYDFYKFVPKVTGKYKMYTEGSLDTYGYLYNGTQSQLTYNDDSGAVNNFLISYDLTAGQTYYLKVRAYSSTKTGTYTINVVNAESNSSASYTAGNIYSVKIMASNVENSTRKIFSLEYDSSKFDIYDLCGFTPNCDTEEGAIQGTGIKILKASDGEINFTVEDEFNLKSISGIVNVVRLKAKTTGIHNINVRMK